MQEYEDSNVDASFSSLGESKSDDKAAPAKVAPQMWEVCKKSIICFKNQYCRCTVFYNPLL